MHKVVRTRWYFKRLLNTRTESLIAVTSHYLSQFTHFASCLMRVDIELNSVLLSPKCFALTANKAHAVVSFADAERSDPRYILTQNMSSSPRAIWGWSLLNSGERRLVATRAFICEKWFAR